MATLSFPERNLSARKRKGKGYKRQSDTTTDREKIRYIFKSTLRNKKERGLPFSEKEKREEVSRANRQRTFLRTAEEQKTTGKKVISKPVLKIDCI